MAQNHFQKQKGATIPIQGNFLALEWTVCQRFRDYSYHAPQLVVFTDNNLLTYVDS